MPPRSISVCTGIALLLSGNGSFGQSGSEYGYVVTTVNMSLHQEKEIIEAALSLPEVIWAEAHSQRVKILADQALPGEMITRLFRSIGVEASSILDVHNDHYLLGAVAEDPVSRGPSAHPGPSQGAEHTLAKQLWLEQHPNWRREHPPIDQDESPSE
jgi:hypothetical protein